MAKKLKVELDVDTSKAKHKVRQDIAGSVEAAASGPAEGANGLAPAMKEAASAAKDFGASAKAQATAMRVAVLSFAGMATGLAAKYVSTRLGEDSAAGKALGYVGTALSRGSQGATAGSALGSAIPGVGNVAGAVGGFALGSIEGAVEQYLENDKAEREKAEAEAKLREQNLKSVEAWEEARRRTVEFRETLEDLNNAETALAERQRIVAEEIRKREEADASLGEKLRGSVGNVDRLNELQKERDVNQRELDQLRQASGALSKEIAKPSFREGFNAPDALSRVGGGFAGQSYMTDRAQRTFDEQLAALKSIDSKTKAGGATWQ